MNDILEHDRDTASLKVPPHSLEAEQSVLGGLMLDNLAWDSVADRLVVDDFYRYEHRLIFNVMIGLAEGNRPLDVVTLSEALEGRDQLDTVGGLAYLAELARNTPSASNIRAYADIVRERATLRKLIRAAGQIADGAFSPQGRPADELVDEAERLVFQIAEERPKSGGPIGMSELLAKAVDRIDEMFNLQGEMTGLSSGFRDLDEMTSGLQPSDLVIIAGRPSMGKTTFAMNLVEHVVIASEKPVMVFSMEMPADSLMLRMLSSLGRIDQTRVRTGQLEDEDWPRLTSAVNLLKDKQLFIDDTAALSPNEIRSRIRRVVREHGNMSLIMIDYLQLMQIPGYSENRTGEISEISRSLKGLAKEFGCPVVALSQLNRSLEKRVRKRTAELRKQTERLRAMAAELASAEQRERRRLASLLHDDLQQLLYGAEMKLGAARGKTEQDAAALEAASEQINKALESARSLTEQLRPPALYEAGLVPALDWLASDMAKKHDLEVILDTGDEVEAGRAEKDFSDDIKAMLYECARELLFNVCKHADVSEARIVLQIDAGSEEAGQRGEEETSGDRLCLVVEDEGRGFEVDRAFENAAENGGFGLLSIRERIAALGGSTEIDSRPERGTRVELTLPLTAISSDEATQPSTPESPARAKAPREAPPQERPLEEGAPGESQTTGAPPPVRVAVADDHAVVREGIANLLAYDERTAVAGEAANGRETIELVKNERPDVVLMDVNMPEMNGIEATREISKHWPETAVIGISVQSDRATERSMLEAGAKAFAPKSGDTDQIINTILQVKEGRSQSDK
jgi:replicative DNA helicase